MLGITKIIKKIFVPSFKFKNLQKVPKNVGGLKKRAACRRGKLIDTQLSQYLLIKNQNKFCQETNLIIEKLKELNLVLIKTQFYVTDDDLKLCTFIDLIAFDIKNQQEMIIEIKRGCHYRLCATQDGQMKFQNPGTTDCLQNQHQLQALLGKMLYQKKFQEIKTSCCLIYVDEKECQYIPEADFNVTITSESLTTIKNLKITKKRKRKS